MFRKRTQKAPPRVRNPRIQPQANKVFSYYNVKRSVEVDESEPHHAARHNRDESVAMASRHKWLRKIVALSIFLFMLALLVLNAQLNPSATQITLRGTPEQRLLLQDESVYKAGVEKIMQDKLQNHTKLTFNGKEFNQAIKKQYPEVSHANVALPLIGGRATVYIEPSPVALLLLSQDKKAHVLNNEGRIISEGISNIPQGVPAVSDQSGIVPKMGAQALPRDDVYAIQLILHQLKEKGLTVESMVLPTAAQRLEVRVQGRPYYIKFNLHSNVLQQVGAYIAVQQKFAREGTSPKEYVDVRVADRIYYK